MSVINVRDRKLGADDVAWGTGSYTYTDANGVTRTTPEINAGTIPVTPTTNIGQYLLDVTVVGSNSELTDALTALGSNYGTIYLKRGTYSPTSITSPANVQLWFENQAILHAGDGNTHTINGPINAGPWQIFSWTGTGSFDLRNCPTQRIYLQWLGATECTSSSGDITSYLLKAYQSLDVADNGDGYKTHDIVVTPGLWRVATPFVYVPAAGWTTTNHWLPNLVGEDEFGSVLYMAVGGSSDGVTMGGLYGGSSRWIQGAQIKNLTVLGDVSGCRHAFYCSCWNSLGGMDNVNLMCGSTDSAVFATSCENSHWNIRLGPGANRYSTGYNTMYAGFEAAKVTGVGYETGLSTVAYLKVHSTFTSHLLYAIKLSDSAGVKIDDSDIEGATAGEVSSYYTNGAAPYTPLYSGGTTKIGQTFTLAAPTEIDRIMFGLNVTVATAITGPVSMSLYATAGGMPTGSAIFTSWKTLDSAELNQGGAGPCIFPTAKQTLAAGTYFAAVEFSGGDVTNYVGASQGSYGSFPPGVTSTCYTYSAGAWHPQTYNIMYAVNPKAALWLDNCTSIFVKSQHMENQNGIACLVDLCRDITIDSQYVGGGIEIQRSKNIVLSGANQYQYISTDSYSSVIYTGTNYSIGNTEQIQDYGASSHLGYFNTWTTATTPSLNIRGNNYINLFANTLLNRWQTDRPDGFGKTAALTWTKCGDGLTDTTRHPLTQYCAKLENNSGAAQENWAFGSLTGNLLDACKGRWVCWSWYQMFPSGQTFTSDQYAAPTITVAAWAPTTQYNIGDAVNDGAAICVEPGISGPGVAPVWGSASPPSYTVDGTVVWLNCGAFSAKGFGSSYSDDVWRRVSFTSFVPTNATAAGFYWQWYGQAVGDSTAYFALPMLNYGTQPLMAPLPYLDGLRTYINGLFIGADSVIPTAAGSIYSANFHNIGDRVYAIGSAAAWVCTATGTPGGWSA